jgi:hypothetical protein
MAKGRGPESGQVELDAPAGGRNGAAPAIPEKAPGKKAARKAAAKAAKVAKGMRKHLKRVEAQLASATKAEVKRGRRLEKARQRTERLQASVEQARAATAVGSALAETTEVPAGAKGKKAVKASPPEGESEPDRPAAQSAPAGVSPPIEAYCLREKKHVQMVDPKPVTTANGGAAISGTCPSCGAGLYKLVGRAAR